MAKQRINDDLIKSLKAQREREGKPQLVVFDDKLPGFGVVVGATATSFIVNRRTPEGLKRHAFARLAPNSSDLPTMSAVQARQEAHKHLGSIVANQPTPADVRRATKAGPTLADAIDLYLVNLKAEGARPSSINTVRVEMLGVQGSSDSYVKAWLTKPLVEITGKDARERHDAITREHGPHIANRVMRQLRACWNHVRREALVGTIAGFNARTAFPENPTLAVNWNTNRNASSRGVSYRERRQEPLAWDALPKWYAAVTAIPNGVRRDYQHLVVLTGLRRRDAATLRWEHINTSDKPVTSRVWNAARSA
jgi:hypothetical protein